MPRLRTLHRRTALGAAALATLACAAVFTVAGPTAAGATTSVPRPDHVVIAMFENKKASSIFGNNQAPYINSLAANGAKFTNSFAIEHPSEPNYLDLFSGSN
jgi:hypothetical protein